MGSYTYLINKKHRICCEATKIDKSNIEQVDDLADFIDLCFREGLQLEVVHGTWFSRELDELCDEAYDKGNKSFVPTEYLEWANDREEIRDAIENLKGKE